MTPSLWVIECRDTTGKHGWMLWSEHSEQHAGRAMEWAERLNGKPHLYKDKEFRAVEYVRSPTPNDQQISPTTKDPK